MNQAAPVTALPDPAPTRSTTHEKHDSERPLVEGIRLLGRILGDVIRVQEGPQAYDLLELICRYRAGLVDERIQRGIHISINGMAAGLRNTA
jgi:phosphoenolpyruvate carboxylase